MRARGAVIAIACALPALLFVPWQRDLDALQARVRECRAHVPDCAPEQTWTDASAALSSRTQNGGVSADVARNAMHTYHLCAIGWFLAVLVPGAPRRAVAWIALLAALALQPYVYTTSGARARPEAAFEGARRWLFPAAYADATDLDFLVDAPTTMALFAAFSLARAHESRAARVIAVLYVLATLQYALVMRLVSTPIAFLTLLTAWTLARDESLAWIACMCPRAAWRERVTRALRDTDTARFDWCKAYLRDPAGDGDDSAPRFEIGTSGTDNDADDDGSADAAVVSIELVRQSLHDVPLVTPIARETVS